MTFYRRIRDVHLDDDLEPFDFDETVELDRFALADQLERIAERLRNDKWGYIGVFKLSMVDGSRETYVDTTPPEPESGLTIRGPIGNTTGNSTRVTTYRIRA